jgi:hypothetical protein
MQIKTVCLHFKRLEILNVVPAGRTEMTFQAHITQSIELGQRNFDTPQNWTKGLREGTELYRQNGQLFAFTRYGPHDNGYSVEITKNFEGEISTDFES